MQRGGRREGVRGKKEKKERIGGLRREPLSHLVEAERFPGEGRGRGGLGEKKKGGETGKESLMSANEVYASSE